MIYIKPKYNFVYKLRSDVKQQQHPFCCNPMGDDLIARGQQLANKAENKLICCCGLFDSNYQDAAELFLNSAKSFKLAKSCLFLFLSHALLLIIIYLFNFFFLCVWLFCYVGFMHHNS